MNVLVIPLLLRLFAPALAARLQEILAWLLGLIAQAGSGTPARPARAPVAPVAGASANPPARAGNRRQSAAPRRASVSSQQISADSGEEALCVSRLRAKQPHWLGAAGATSPRPTRGFRPLAHIRGPPPRLIEPCKRGRTRTTYLFLYRNYIGSLARPVAAREARKYAVLHPRRRRRERAAAQQPAGLGHLVEVSSTHRAHHEVEAHAKPRTEGQGPLGVVRHQFGNRITFQHAVSS